jgi:mannose-6-phosphate isomerase-like protein (cupin superfamily)
VIEEFIECKRNGTTKVFKGFHNNVLTWDEFANIVYSESKEEPQIKELGDYDKSLGGKIHGNMIVKQDLYLYVLPTIVPDKCAEVIDKFKSYGMVLGLSNYYINLSNNINNIPSHNDPLDNFYWQCQGSVEWVANGGQTYMVEPGDLVYIPAKTNHGVNFLNNPRGAVGFAADLSEYVQA